MVQAIPVPTRSGPHVSPLADAHGIRRSRHRAPRAGRGTVRALVGIRLMRLEDRLKAQARALGFDLVGMTQLGPPETAPMFDEWIARGFAGEMSYLERG